MVNKTPIQKTEEMLVSGFCCSCSPYQPWKKNILMKHDLLDASVNVSFVSMTTSFNSFNLILGSQIPPFPRVWCGRMTWQQKKVGTEEQPDNDWTVNALHYKVISYYRTNRVIIRSSVSHSFTLHHILPKRKQSYVFQPGLLQKQTRQL